MAYMRVSVLAFGLMLAILPMRAPGASAAAGCGTPPPQLGKFTPAQPGARLPAAPFVGEDGADRPLDGLRGEGLVLNIWATWCAPCVEEMPALDKLAAQSERIGVRVLPLSADREGAAVVRRFYVVNKIAHLPVVLDRTGRVARAVGVGGLPTTLLYDSDGNEVGRVVGVARWDAPEVVDFLATCLAGRT